MAENTTATQNDTDVDIEQMTEAHEKTWHGFTKASTYGTGIIAAAVVILLLVFA